MLLLFKYNLGILILTASVCHSPLWRFDVAATGFDTIVSAEWCCYPMARRCTTRDYVVTDVTGTPLIRVPRRLGSLTTRRF